MWFLVKIGSIRQTDRMRSIARVSPRILEGLDSVLLRPFVPRDERSSTEARNETVKSNAYCSIVELPSVQLFTSCLHVQTAAAVVVPESAWNSARTQGEHVRLPD